MNKSIAVLIPCFNEEQTVAAVIEGFKSYLPESTIYVYDNCSVDRTASVARLHGAVVNKSPKLGKGYVIQQMFREVEADIYIIVDGDNTYSAADVRTMIDKLDEGYDMAIGDRLSSTYFSENKNPFRALGNRTVRYCVNKLFHGNVTDVMTGYRAMTRRFVKAVQLSSGGFEIETEMTIWSLENSMNIGSVPIQYRDRPFGSVSKLHTLSDGIKVLWFIFKSKIFGRKSS